jgi:hypothetical protein
VAGVMFAADMVEYRIGVVGAFTCLQRCRNEASPAQLSATPLVFDVNLLFFEFQP